MDRREYKTSNITKCECATATIVKKTFFIHKKIAIVSIKSAAQSIQLNARSFLVIIEVVQNYNH